IAWLWTQGDESGETRVGEVIYGKDKDMSYSKRLPQAGSGSHYMNLGGDLNFIGGLKEPLSLIDFIKGNKLRTLYKRIDYATEAVDK
ncbi:hypothetical protein ABTM94_19540, partial [Acinetobacter baumannii]